MRITALQPQATDQDRINIFVDNQFFMGANAFIVLMLHLKVGQELTPELLAQLRQEEALQKAVDQAMSYLSFRPRSREEVRRYLRKKELAPELIETVLEKLDRMELVNDQAFASFWIEARERFRPKGAQAIKNELRLKGVKREVVDDMVTDEHDEDLALRAGKKKALSLIRQPDIDYNTFRTRLGPFLQRRGFSYEIATRTVKALWEELKAESPDDFYEE